MRILNNGLNRARYIPLSKPHTDRAIRKNLVDLICSLSTLVVVRLKQCGLAVALAILTSCGGTETWIPLAPNRPAVTREQVQYLENPPQRPHTEIGIITPPSGEYETEAEAVKAMRKEAAKHGADAIYIESAAKEGGWHFGFSRFGGEGGSFSDVQYRAKAIVWR
jgi:hypothetical protein